MARSILNSLSTVQIVVLFIGGMVLLTVLGVLVGRRLFPGKAEEFERVADSLRVVYELIFALILAFVIAAVLDEMGDAESAVASEATSIGALVRVNDALPARVGRDLDEAVSRYVHAVADDEWETMKDGESSPRATAAQEGLHAEYNRIKPASDNQGELYGQALDDLHEVGSRRRERLDIASADLPTMLRVLVIVGLVLLLVLEYRPHLARFAGIVFMGTLAMVTTGAFLLTVVLDYPFAGDVSVSNAPLKEGNLARFWSEELAYRPKPGDKQRPLTAEGLEGVYDSTAYGTLVLACHDSGPPYAPRECRPGDRRLRGVYRYYDGTLTGELVDGVFHGWWTEAPTHRDHDYAGRVELRLVETSDGPLVAGSWAYQYEEPLEPGWDLQEVGGEPPPDLARRLERRQTFIEEPRSPSAVASATTADDGR